MINVFQPSLGSEELEAVGRVFASNWVGKGRLTEGFERAFAAYLGVSPPHLRSINSCTEGLFQSIALLDIGAGDEVILPSLSFVGAANAIAASGARPVFCDVDPRTLNATAEHIDACITPRTKAILLLHYGGVPCEMDAICALAAAKGIPLIEDSACSVASSYHGRPCGTMGDIGVWSFDAMKILVTGDGGMVYCRDQERAALLDKLIYLGLEQPSGFSQAAETRHPQLARSANAVPSADGPARGEADGPATPDRWWAFEVSEFGRRSIMNDVSAAIGLEQLRKLPAFIERRRQVHAFYDAALAELGWLQTPPALPLGVESSYYFYWVQKGTPDRGDPRRDRLAAHLRQRGIYTTFRYYPLHHVRAYGSGAHLPNADLAAETTLCLPQHQGLSDDDLGRVVEAILDFDPA